MLFVNLGSVRPQLNTDTDPIPGYPILTLRPTHYQLGIGRIGNLTFSRIIFF
jgi:hypothetical protein